MDIKIKILNNIIKDCDLSITESELKYNVKIKLYNEKFSEVKGDKLDLIEYLHYLNMCDNDINYFYPELK